MSSTPQDLKSKLQKRAQDSGVPANGRPESLEMTVYRALEKLKPQIAAALPQHMTPDRMARMAFTAIRTTPKLLQCSMESLMGAVITASQLGLEPGVLGQCWILPYGAEAKFVAGYQGMITLARRSGEISTIFAEVVYRNDYFKMARGLDPVLEHIPWHVREDEQPTEPGSVRGAYMVARFKDGGYFFDYMTTSEIEEHRKSSKQPNGELWTRHYIEACKKTVVRRGSKYLPVSTELFDLLAKTDENSPANEAQLAESLASVAVINTSATEAAAEPDGAPAPDAPRANLNDLLGGAAAPA